VYGVETQGGCASSSGDRRQASRNAEAISNARRDRNSFDTRCYRGRIKSNNPPPRRPCRDALASVGADLSARLPARRIPTVLPLAASSSPRLFVSWSKAPCIRQWPNRCDTKRPSSQTWSFKAGASLTGSRTTGASAVGLKRREHAGIQQGKRRRHDWLQGAGPAGGRGAGALWQVRRAQESKGSGCFALAVSSAPDRAAAGKQPGGDILSAAVERRVRADWTARKSTAFHSQRQPAFLVLDDTGRHGGGRCDLQPNDDRRRHGAATFSLSLKGRYSVRPVQVHLSRLSREMTLIRGNRP
jgi:hypothetical protein